MSVDWNWKKKVGEIDVTYNKGTSNEWKTKFTIFSANCLGCWLNIKEETIEEKISDEGKPYKTFSYDFEGFFGDEGHMKRCLGLIRCQDGTKSNLVKNSGMFWDEVRLDSSWYYTKTWVKNLAKANMRVVVDDFVNKEGWDKQYE